MADADFTFGKSAMLFPTPVLSYTIADAERVNAALLAEIEARRGAEAGVVRSNRAGWHSASDFFDRTEPAHVEVAKAINRAVVDATGRLRGRGSTASFAMQLSGWINVNPPLAYNVPHDHPGSFWSGCYYVRTDPEGPRPDHAGAITFIDSRTAPAGQSVVQALVFKGSYSAQPAPGTLLLFPSTVKHWVHPNASDEDRITVAFNGFILGKPEPPRAVPAAAGQAS